VKGKRKKKKKSLICIYIYIYIKLYGLYRNFGTIVKRGYLAKHGKFEEEAVVANRVFPVLSDEIFYTGRYVTEPYS
jgi:hypothetical protein